MIQMIDRGEFVSTIEKMDYYKREPEHLMKAIAELAEPVGDKLVPFFRLIVDWNIVRTIPKIKSTRRDIEVFFFHVGHSLTLDELEREYQERNLAPVPFVLLIANLRWYTTFPVIFPTFAYWDLNDEGVSILEFFSHPGVGSHFMRCHRKRTDEQCHSGAGDWFPGIQRGAL